MPYNSFMFMKYSVYIFWAFQINLEDYDIQQTLLEIIFLYFIIIKNTIS